MSSNNLAPLQVKENRILRLKGEHDKACSNKQPINSDNQNQDRLSRLLPRKYRLFFVVNLLLILLVTAALLTNRYANISTGMYVVSLFIICTAPLLFIRSYKGRSSLLLIFLAYYFATFALKDLTELYSNQIRPVIHTGAIFTLGEIAIIIGAICFVLGYVIGGALFAHKKAGLLDREWSTKTTAIAGLIFWVVGFYVTVVFQFGFADIHSGIKINTSIGGFIALLRILHPMGSLLLIYLFLTTRNKTILILMLTTFALDFMLGFVGDSKEIAFRSPLLYIFSVLILKEKLPLVETITFSIVAGIAFNIFSEYRLDVHSGHESRGSAIENIGEKLDTISQQRKTLSERFNSGIDYFVTRITLKNHVERIVQETGKSVEYMNGYTIEPLLYAFIPRFIMPEKRDSAQAGRLYNQHFQITGASDTYISMSQLGELYWNFGWTGLTLGMMLIGAIMGIVANIMRLDKNPTLSKFLLLLLTTYLLALRFESALAKTYVVWLRTMLFFILIQMFVPKIKKLTSIT